MTKKDILDWFAMNSESLDSNRILFVLGIGMIVAAIIFVTYRITYSGVLYNARFNTGNAVMLLIAAVLMMMISSNIAISLGMVGALSIVRFRTAVKDGQDTIYIFWSIVEGLCIGAQMYKLAFISTIAIAMFFVAASFYCNIHKKFLIIVRGDAALKADAVVQCVGEVYKKICLRSVNYGEGHGEIIVEVQARNEIDSELIEKIRRNPGVLSVNCLLEMGEHIG